MENLLFRLVEYSAHVLLNTSSDEVRSNTLENIQNGLLQPEISNLLVCIDRESYTEHDTLRCSIPCCISLIRKKMYKHAIDIICKEGRIDLLSKIDTSDLVELYKDPAYINSMLYANPLIFMVYNRYTHYNIIDYLISLNFELSDRTATAALVRSNFGFIVYLHKNKYKFNMTEMHVYKKILYDIEDLEIIRAILEVFPIGVLNDKLDLYDTIINGKSLAVAKYIKDKLFEDRQDDYIHRTLDEYKPFSRKTFYKETPKPVLSVTDKIKKLIEINCTVNENDLVLACRKLNVEHIMLLAERTPITKDCIIASMYRNLDIIKYVFHKSLPGVIEECSNEILRLALLGSKCSKCIPVMYSLGYRYNDTCLKIIFIRGHINIFRYILPFHTNMSDELKMELIEIVKWIPDRDINKYINQLE